MEVKVIISLDEATQKIITNLTAAIAGATVSGLLKSKPIEGGSIKFDAEEKPVEKKAKRQFKAVTEVSGVEIMEAEEKDFAEEIDEIDNKKASKNKNKAKPIDYTIEDVRATLAAKKKAGHGAGIKAILKEYEVSMVSDLDPADYADVITAVNAL